MLRSAIITCVLLCLAFIGKAQNHLEKKISVNFHDIRLETVLDSISHGSGFFFSYNSTIVPADSLVTVKVENKTIRQVLDYMFRGAFEYKEVENHVIIRRPDAGQYYYVTGYITDEVTGEKLRDVSVFESHQLVASLTNEQGYFKLRLKDKIPAVSLNISKSWYSDTAVHIKTGVSQEIKVSIKPKNFELDSVVIGGSTKVESTWWGKLFLSSKQRVQSINLNKFFVETPIQGSIVPGLGSHGKMSGQVTNSVSMNLLAGYSAGVAGVEVGGLVNIVKNDAMYVQACGLANIVGGKFAGFQGAGIHNNVLGNFVGVQTSGISNVVRKDLVGLQAAGIANLTIGKVTGGQFSGIINASIDSFVGFQGAGIVNSSVKEFEGVQAAGVVNFSAGKVKGVQITGILNVAATDMEGVQASGILNYATRVKGVQFGLVNVADTSSGVGVGLVSFVLKGYHKMSISTNEVVPYEVSVKTGTHWLYNIFSAGIDPSKNNKVYMFGIGWGSELPISNRFSINPELTGHGVYLGSWEELNSMVKLSASLNAHFGRYISVFAGPSFVMYHDNNMPKAVGYADKVLPNGYKRNNYSTNLSSWVGWNAGITIF
ncbi:MAG: carboxypeptidase-like regulatory domain-containing protein [Chitinophagaceae bacterium]|nr:carboxypeptidase-like regulatory domain-containing protein [Chitinophagaceae bacterium]